MPTSIVLTAPVLNTLLTKLVREPQQSVSCGAGFARFPDHDDILVSRIGGGDAAIFAAAPNRVELSRRLRSLSLGAQPSTKTVVVLGVGAAAGWIGGLVRTGEDWKPLSLLRVAGAGLPAIDLTSEPVNLVPAKDFERWSRTIGALGERAWRRMRSSHVGIVGCGRTGSLVSNALSKVGVGHLSLIDFDRLELHNLGEMDLVGEAHLGQTKSAALACSLKTGTAVEEPVSSIRALVALKECDILISCVDNAAARLLTGFLAMNYLKPMLDIGTGIIGSGMARRMGADVRLILPDRCLLCFGAVADLSEAREQLSGKPGRSEAASDWREERAGSLRSLNQLGVGLGMRLLEDFVGAQVTESVWLRMEYGATGTPSLERRSPAPRDGCRCAWLRGIGDEGISALGEWLQ